jgi:hypothetical protein
MPAHIRTVLSGIQLAIPIMQGGLPWGLGRGFICSSVGAPLIGEKSPCIWSANHRLKINHTSKTHPIYEPWPAIVANSRNANALTFLWMKLQ